VEFKGADQDSTTVPGDLPPLLLIFSDEDFFGVTEEVKYPNLTATTPCLQACMDCGLDSRLYTWIC